MTDFTHHTPKLLTEADAAADLAGLPRPSEAPQALPRLVSDSDLIGDRNIAAVIRQLVSERDALAVRVAELEAERDAAAQIACGAVRKAFSLGQTYWQQADSEYTSQHRKAEDTWATFKALIEETRDAINVPKGGM